MSARKSRSYGKRPRTTQEKRSWFDSLEQDVQPRHCRSPKNLPDSWNDYPVNSIGKTWKRRSKRKHQYYEIREQKCKGCRWWHPYVGNKSGYCKVCDKELEEKYGRELYCYDRYIGYYMEYKNTFADEACPCWKSEKEYFYPKSHRNY